MIIQMTALQAEILRHRLDVPDAISEAITGSANDSRIHAVCDALDTNLSARELDTHAAEITHAELTRAVLCDAVCGSTYYAAAKGWGNASPLQLENIYRAGTALAEKIGAYADTSLDFPNC